MKQSLIFDKENNAFHGGIILDDGNIVCCCCGSLIEKDNVTDKSGKGNILKEMDIEYKDSDDAEFEIIDIYSTWVNLDAETIGN